MSSRLPVKRRLLLAVGAVHRQVRRRKARRGRLPRGARRRRATRGARTASSGRRGRTREELDEGEECEGQASRKLSEKLEVHEVEEQLLLIESRLQLEEPSLQDQLRVQGRAKLGSKRLRHLQRLLLRTLRRRRIAMGTRAERGRLGQKFRPSRLSSIVVQTGGKRTRRRTTSSTTGPRMAKAAKGSQRAVRGEQGRVRTKQVE